VNTGQWCFISLLLQKKTKPHASFTLNIYPEPLGDLHLTIRHLVTDTMTADYEKISNAILAGVLRDDIECTGIVVTHTLSKFK
jgi:hypothetical protein